MHSRPALGEVGLALIFAALGGMFSERGGVVNIGLEGLMLISAFAGVVGASLSGNAFVGLGFALAAGLAFALIHALMCVTFEADQIISGTAINLLALGGTGFLGARSRFGTRRPERKSVN